MTMVGATRSAHEILGEFPAHFLPIPGSPTYEEAATVAELPLKPFKVSSVPLNDFWPHLLAIETDRYHRYSRRRLVLRGKRSAQRGRDGWKFRRGRS